MGDNSASAAENWLDPWLMSHITILQGRDESPNPVALRPSSNFKGRHMKGSGVLDDYLKICALPPSYFVSIIPTPGIVASICNLCFEPYADGLHWPAMLARCGHVFGAACIQHYIMERIVSNEKSERSNRDRKEQAPEIICPHPFCGKGVIPLYPGYGSEPLYRYIDRSGKGSKLKRVQWPVKPSGYAGWCNEIWWSWKMLSLKSPRWMRIDPLEIELIQDRHDQATHPSSINEIIFKNSATRKIPERWSKAILEDKIAVHALYEVFKSWSNDNRHQELNDALVHSILLKTLNILSSKLQKESLTTWNPLEPKLSDNEEITMYLSMLVTHSLIIMRRKQRVAF